MADSNSNSSSKSSLMEQLLNQSLKKSINLRRGDEVEGKVISVLDNELVLDLGTKSEGLISKKEFGNSEVEVGQTVKAYVIQPENESGQVILSLQRAVPTSSKVGFDKTKRWQRFLQARGSNSKMTGKVTEVNKGGLIIEVDGVRGFLPTSQIGLNTLSQKAKQGLEELVGQELSLTVIEADPAQNRLIFSDREVVSDDLKQKLADYKMGQVVKTPIQAVAPFGLFVDLNGVEGVIFAHETNWEKVEGEDLVKQFKAGQEIEAKVVGIDETLGRVQLSLRQLEADPFEKLMEDFQIDDVVKGTVKEVDGSGVKVELEKGVEGFMTADKVDPDAPYSAGQSTNFLVDSVDKQKRRINLAPFLTSTKGLIYK